MDDIAPRLLKVIRDDFETRLKENNMIAALYKRVRDGTASYTEANDFAIEVGKLLASAFQNNLSSEILPDGKMYYNIAQRVIEPMMKNNYALITDVTDQVQQTLNKAAGIGIKPITPELNQDRIDGILDKTASAEVYDEVAWVLGEPMVNFSQSIVDDAIKANAEFHAKAGLRPKIIRKVSGNCCEWCRNLAGTYSYPNNVPEDVYRRHQRCRCTVDYIPGDGRVQNVHTKQWQTQEEYDKIEVRKQVGLRNKASETPREKEKRVAEQNGLELAQQIAGHPKMLGAYTPEGLLKALQNKGYEAKPMNSGNYKGIPFEEGGGFKINFGGDGILMYHPEKRSHHGGAYYKISTGKGGTHRYDIKGNEIGEEE